MLSKILKAAAASPVVHRHKCFSDLVLEITNGQIAYHQEELDFAKSLKVGDVVEVPGREADDFSDLLAKTGIGASSQTDQIVVSEQHIDGAMAHHEKGIKRYQEIRDTLRNPPFRFC